LVTHCQVNEDVFLQLIDYMVRPERLLAAAPLVLRFAPDRRRALRGSVQPGSAGLSNSSCLSAGSSNLN